MSSAQGLSAVLTKDPWQFIDACGSRKIHNRDHALGNAGYLPISPHMDMQISVSQPWGGPAGPCQTGGVRPRCL